MNVVLEKTTVMLMPLVLTLMEDLHVLVLKDIQEMETHVQV